MRFGGPSRLATGMTILVLAGASSAARWGPAPVLVNESASLPRGLYVRRPGVEPRHGQVVAVAQPEGATAYLQSLGVPEEVWLIKRVAAMGGETVCRQGDLVRTPDRVVAVRARDGRGRGLPSWTGCGRLRPDQLFLLGDTPTSFDSRYFGPVSRRDLKGVYREAVRW